MITLRKSPMSVGDDVKLLQETLNAKGYDCGTADGKYGKKTEAAVKQMQKDYKLTADGLFGVKSATALGILAEIEEIQGKASEGDCSIKCEDLKQFSSPHGSMIYGPNSSYSTYKSGGCGVASFAIVQRAYGLAPDGETATKTIQRLGKYSWEHGFRPKGAGTNAGLFKTNGTKYTTTTSASKILQALREGKLVILLIKNGFPNGYGGTGHYIVAYGIKGDYVLLRDVGSSTANRQKALASKISNGLKNAYIMEKS